MRNRPLVSPQRSALMAARAQGNRANLTPSEQALWERIKGRQLGVAFRRQVVSADRFIADFAAVGVRLVVEVDGEWHRGREAADARRDRMLAQLGYRVLRIDAELIRRAPDEAVALIRAALED